MKTAMFDSIVALTNAIMYDDIDLVRAEIYACAKPGIIDNRQRVLFMQHTQHRC